MTCGPHSAGGAGTHGIPIWASFQMQVFAEIICHNTIYQLYMSKNKPFQNSIIFVFLCKTIKIHGKKNNQNANTIPDNAVDTT